LSFQVAAGTVTGRDHVVSGRPNQDAYAVWRGPDAVVAVVADGCGSQRGSETGARVGAHLLADALRRHRRRIHGEEAAVALEDVRRDVLDHLRRLASAMGERLEPTVAEFFLFTLVGALVTDEHALVFALGDGVVAVNGDVRVLSFPRNEPPYLGYGLLGAGPAFAMLAQRPTAEVESILIGTDGLAALLDGGALPLSDLWSDDRFFRNPAALTRRLTLVNRPQTRIDWERRRVERAGGLLSDDTSVVVLRRA
jgi:hypothetical protein